jgi:hypothetical protein
MYLVNTDFTGIIHITNVKALALTLVGLFCDKTDPYDHILVGWSLIIC